MFFDRHRGGEKAFLVYLVLNQSKESFDYSGEFEELVDSAGLEQVELVKVRCSLPSSRYFIGSGKVLEIQQMIAALKIDVVLFSHALSASQEKNLEKEFQCKVVDRTGLILDIFAQRARTFEGKLQVELAQLQHLSTRLVRGWTHLERQKGGIGLRGPGETQLETDRRLLRVRVNNITSRLQKVESQRRQARQYRQKSGVLTVSLVGYTNAGKSTLFNRLTSSQVYEKNRLFSTLDTTFRRLVLPELGETIFTDTVGFIRDLPHRLINAFHATLEESAQADLLLHVIDGSDPNREETTYQVEKVLNDIGAANVLTLKVYNKMDLLEYMPTEIQYDKNMNPEAVWVSAKSGVGLDLLNKVMIKLLGCSVVRGLLQLNSNQGKIRSYLYRSGYVESELMSDKGNFLIRVCLPSKDLDRLMKKERIPSNCFVE